MPPEINFGDDDPFCTGLKGTDIDVLNCVADREAKTLTFDNVMQFSEANPGEMIILLENLRNPVENIITSSFGIKTMTFDGYDMDQIQSNITVNFFCEYPCAACPPDDPKTCTECYQTSTFRYFFEA